MSVFMNQISIHNDILNERRHFEHLDDNFDPEDHRTSTGRLANSPLGRLVNSKDNNSRTYSDRDYDESLAKQLKESIDNEFMTRKKINKPLGKEKVDKRSEKDIINSQDFKKYFKDRIAKCDNVINVKDLDSWEESSSKIDFIREACYTILSVLDEVEEISPHKSGYLEGKIKKSFAQKINNPSTHHVRLKDLENIGKPIRTRDKTVDEMNDKELFKLSPDAYYMKHGAPLYHK